MKKTVFITGASSGFGRSTVKLFVEKGWNVIATMRSPEKDRELLGLDGVLVTRLDVTDKSSISEAVAAGVREFGQIDVLVNNAGYGTLDLLQKSTGKSTMEHIHLELVERAKSLLWGTENSISEIAYEHGFEHPSHFTKVFKAKTGKSPREYRSLI